MDCMRGFALLMVASWLLVGCGKSGTSTVDPAAPVPTAKEPGPSSPETIAKTPPVTEEAKQANQKLAAVLVPSSPAANVAPEHYPGSVPLGAYAYQRTNGKEARIDTWKRSTADSLDEVATFYTDHLGVRETSHLEDRRILTGSRPNGTLLAVTLLRKGEVTEITLVVSVAR